MTEDFEETGIIVGRLWFLDSGGVLPADLGLELSINIGVRNPVEDVWAIFVIG